MSYNHISICLPCNIIKPNKKDYEFFNLLGFDFKPQNSNSYLHIQQHIKVVFRFLIECPRPKTYQLLRISSLNDKQRDGNLKVFQSFPTAIFYSKWQADAEILSVLLVAAFHFNYFIPIAIILCSIVVHICSHHAKGQHT